MSLRSDRGNHFLGRRSGGSGLLGFVDRFCGRVLRHPVGYVLSRRGSGILLASLFFVGGIFYGAHLGGHSVDLAGGVHRALGFGYSNIVISGASDSRRSDSRRSMIVSALSGSRSLFGFDVNTARASLMDLAWVESVSIRKHYPDSVYVDLRESRPFAMWQHDGSLTLVNDDGVVIDKFGITDLVTGRYRHLRHLVGEGAASRADEILPLVSRFDSLSDSITAYIRVADRRWDLVLSNGVRAQLPEQFVARSLSRLSSLVLNSNISSGMVSVIDLRLPDRVTLRLSPLGQDNRKLFLVSRVNGEEDKL